MRGHAKQPASPWNSGVKSFGTWILAALCLSVCAAAGFAQSDPRLPFPGNRVRDFYARQAEEYLDRQWNASGSGESMTILPQFPGLDGGGFGHWGQNPEESSYDQSLNAVDTGNVVCQLTRHFGSTTAKAVNVSLDGQSECAVLFDPLKLTFRDAWRGGFVRWGFARFGLMGGVEATGERLCDFSGSEWTLPDGTNPQYRGFYRFGRHVAFHSQIGDADVLDSLTGDSSALIRTLQIDGELPASGLTLLITPDDGNPSESATSADNNIRISSSDGSRVLVMRLLSDNPGVRLVLRERKVVLEFQGGEIKAMVQVQFRFTSPHDDGQQGVTADDQERPLKPHAIPSLVMLREAAAGQWTSQIVETRAVPGDPDAPVAIDSITLPHGERNPFGSAMRLGGAACFRDGRVAVCTLMGEVWVVDGLTEHLETPLRWQRVAAGLYQSLGLVIEDDRILVLGADQLTRLHDFNGDGEADFYECVTNAYPTTGGHDFCTSLQRDAQGRLYWAVASGDLGVVQMDKSGTLVSLGNGLRNSNGIGVSTDGNVVLATVQEGTWTPASAIFETKNGSYHGLKGPRSEYGRYGYDLPLCFIPRGVDNSSGEIGFLPEDSRLGPLAGAAIGTSFGSCQAYLVLRDVVNGKSQGAVVPLPGDYLSGICRVTWNSRDGAIYLAGTEGWQSYSKEPGCLHRLRVTGHPLPLPKAVEAYSNGVILRFSEPLDPDSVSPENTFCQQWNYLYSAGYGSPEFSVREPGQKGHDVVPVLSARLLPDRHSVFLEIPQIHPVMQFHIHLRLRTAGGYAFAPDVFASLFELRPDFDQFDGYRAVVKRRAPDFPIAERYEQDPRLVRQEQLGTNFGWVSGSKKLSVSATPGLQFEPRRLRVAPRTRVSLAFRNSDPSMPHNIAIVRADTIDEFGEQSMQLASNPRAIATHYVPESSGELCFSPILQPGDQYTLFFEAPEEPGEYKLVCTYPGHWRVMQGSLFVLADADPLPESALRPARKFVQMWTMSDFAEDADLLSKRSFRRGRDVFESAGCIRCHQIAGTGTPLGPDLTKIAERFLGEKLLQQILDPSAEINRQYQTWVAALDDGRVIAGLMTEQSETSVTLLPNPLRPETKIVLDRSQIEELEPSLISTMPASLLITYTREEVLDLLAFVQSGGNPAHPLFDH